MTSTFSTLARRLRRTADRVAASIVAPFVWLSDRLVRLDERLLGLRTDEPVTDEAVLAWAGRIASKEPRFAAELRAAVLRKQALEGLR
jgi:hypothetical protein